MPRVKTGYNGKVTRYDGGVSVPHMGDTDRAVHFHSQPCIFGLPSWRTQLGSRGFTNIIRLDTNLYSKWLVVEPPHKEFIHCSLVNQHHHPIGWIEDKHHSKAPETGMVSGIHHELQSLFCTHMSCFKKCR